jgi:hypothetical protein
MATDKLIDGVGVLFCPLDVTSGVLPPSTLVRDLRKLAESIQQRSIICLPSSRDENDHLLWDFRIEGGDPGQVEVRRSDEVTEPFIVEGGS